MKKIPFILKLNYAEYRNEDAFTLVEMLLSFSVLLTIIFFVTPVLQIFQNNVHLQERIEAMEWDVFCSQMKKEIRMSTKVQVTGNTLVLTEDSGMVVYEQYEKSLRRRVNYTGHEILLQNISAVNFTLLKNSVQVTVKDLKGKDYTISVYSLLDWNGAF